MGDRKREAPLMQQSSVGERCRRVSNANAGVCRLRRVLIVSMATWWCFHFDNCVQVEAQVVTCPSECQCYDQNMNYVNCEGRGLRTLPSAFSESTKRLVLRDNSINKLRRNVFKKLSKVEILDLANNDITDIPATVFSELKKLYKLDLSGNQFSQVPKDALRRLQSLRHLSLRNNPIIQLLAYNFLPLKSLRYLDIGELRTLTYISNQVFRGLQLQTLKMDTCQLREIPLVRSLANLRVLDLSSNKVRIVGAESFVGMKKLTTLSLAYCDVTVIEKGAFDDLNSLQSFSLAYNNMTTVTPDLLPTRGAMQFEGNKWLCNCDLIDFARYLQTSEVCSGPSCGKCEYPTMYRGMPVIDLTSVQNPPCAARIVKGDAGGSMNVSAGTPVKIPCPKLPVAKRRTDPVEVKWYSPDGKPIKHGSFQIRITSLVNGSLNFTYVKMEDTGIYKCAVTRNGENVAETTIFLNVTGPNDGTTLSTWTTETTVTIVKGQNPAPPTLATKYKPQFAYSTNPRYATRSLPRPPTTTTPTNPVRSTLTTKPFNKPVFTNTPDTAVQVMETTKIIVGCFVGITLLAAALLVIFYKLRRRNYNQRRDSRQRKSVDSDPTVPRDQRLDSTLVNHNNYLNREKTMENRTLNSRMGMCATSASTTPSQTPCSDVTAPLPWKPSASYAPKQRFAPLHEEVVQVLPPPPEELKFQTTRARCNGPRAPQVDNHVTGAQTLPNRGSGGAPVQKQLLSSIASSCQQVALQRRSYVGEGTRNGNHSNNQTPAMSGGMARAHHRSCDNLKKSCFMSYPTVDGDITSVQDVDFATGMAAAKIRRSVRLVEPPPRKIPIRMRSLEGLLNHKETEI